MSDRNSGLVAKCCSRSVGEPLCGEGFSVICTGCSQAPELFHWEADEDYLAGGNSDNLEDVTGNRFVPCNKFGNMTRITKIPMMNI